MPLPGDTVQSYPQSFGNNLFRLLPTTSQAFHYYHCVHWNRIIYHSSYAWTIRLARQFRPQLSMNCYLPSLQVFPLCLCLTGPTSRSPRGALKPFQKCSSINGHKRVFFQKAFAAVIDYQKQVASQKSNCTEQVSRKTFGVFHFSCRKTFGVFHAS